WIVIGLARAASAKRPLSALLPAPSFGTVEAGLILGALCGFYLAFVAAQLVALSDGGHHVLVIEGLTYAQYARSGFFQLLACAALPFVFLLAGGACPILARRGFPGLSGLPFALTFLVVVVATRGLQLYGVALGLTLLRLACLAVAGWMGGVFLLLGASFPRR